MHVFGVALENLIFFYHFVYLFILYKYIFVRVIASMLYEYYIYL